MSLKFKVEIEVELTEGEEQNTEEVFFALRDAIEEDLEGFYLDDEETAYVIIDVRPIL